jgi:predicted secreted protein
MRKMGNGFRQCVMRYALCFFCCTVIFLPSVWAKMKTSTLGHITPTDAQKPILLHRPNQAFSIILKSNPTTGYIWLLTQFDSMSIKPIKSIYHAPFDKNQKKPALVGAPGYEEWHFRLKRPAMNVPRVMTITFCMMRPWTINCDIKKTFTVIYTI